MCLTYLMIKYHFPPSICFVKDIKLIQHDWIIKHILDNILSHDASNLNIIIKDIFYFLLFKMIKKRLKYSIRIIYLTNQHECKFMRWVNFSSPCFSFCFLSLPLQSFRLFLFSLGRKEN